MLCCNIYVKCASRESLDKGDEIGNYMYNLVEVFAPKAKEVNSK